MGDGDNLEWACSKCEQKRPGDLHDYTRKMLQLRHLTLAGYPLQANDLTVEEWADLGSLQEVMTGKQKAQEITLLARMLGIKLTGG
jgi:hypothetical protein